MCSTHKYSLIRRLCYIAKFELNADFLEGSRGGHHGSDAGNKAAGSGQLHKTQLEVRETMISPALFVLTAYCLMFTQVHAHVTQ